MRKQIMSILTTLLVALLTVISAGSCKTLKMKREAVKQQRQAYLDSLQREDSMAKARMIEDSIRQSRGDKKLLYGVPSMRDRRVVNPDLNVE